MNEVSKIKTKINLQPALPTGDQFSLDRNFTKYAYKFYTNFGDDYSLVIGIICFIQKNLSSLTPDLFGNYEFDIKEFMKFYNASKVYLYREHPSPYYKTVDTQQKAFKNFYNRVLGNALFMLYSKPFNEFCIQRDTVEKKNYTLTERYYFFKTLDVTEDITVNGVEKFKIVFSLPDNVELNVFKLFDKVQNSVITNPKLRKNNLEGLYLYLSNAKNICCFRGVNRFDVVPDSGMNFTPFDFLSMVMQVDKITKFKDRKIKMNQKMKVLNEITNDPVILSFDDSSTKKSTNQPYFTWANFTPYTEEEKNDKYYSAFRERYYMNLKNAWQLYHITPTNVMEKYPFKEWMEIKSYDIKFKMDAFIKTAAELWGKKLDKNSEQVVMEFGTPEQKQKLQADKFYKRI